jgi:hypothetical protein
MRPVRDLRIATLLTALAVATGASPVTAQSGGASVALTTTVSHLAPQIPNSGPINTVAINPDDPAVILVASESGGLFGSTSGGRDWSHADDLPTTAVQDVAFVAGSQLVLASAGQGYETHRTGGLYARTYTGTFTLVDGVLPTVGLRCAEDAGAHQIAIAPDQDRIYVATDCGLAIGTAGDLQFRTVDIGQPDPRVEAVAALADGHLIAGGPGIGVWYSRDDGATWSPETSGIGVLAGSDHGLHSLAADPRGGDRGYAITSTTELWQTDDGGQTWLQIPAPTGGGGCSGIANVHAVQEVEDVKLYAGNWCDTYVAELRPNGTWSTWSKLVADGADTRDLAFRPDTGAPYLLGTSAGIHVASDPTHFTRIGGPSSGLDAIQATEVVGQYLSAQRNPDLYFGTQYTNAWSMNGSTTEVAATLEGDGFAFGLPRVVTPETENKVTLTTCWRCTNRISDSRFADTADWPDASPGVSGPKFLALATYVQAVDGRDGHPAGLWQTTTTGRTWSQIAEIPQPQLGLPHTGGPAADATLIQPVGVGVRASDGVAIVHLARVTGFASGSGGTVRYPVMSDFGSLGVAPTGSLWSEVLAVDPQDPARIIAPDVVNGDMRMTVDGGDTWRPLPGLTNLVTQSGDYRFSVPAGNRLAPIVSVVSFCPDNNSRILLGTHQGGSYFSYDGGETWRAIPDTEPITFATSVFWQSGCGTAYLSTFSRGIWRIKFVVHNRRVIDPGRPCVGANCRLVDVLRERPIEFHPGIVVSDGYITAIEQSRKGATVHVSAGSIVTFYRRKPPAVRIVIDRGIPPPTEEYTFAAFFEDGRLIRSLSLPEPIQLFPQVPTQTGPGLDQPLSPQQGEIEIDSDLILNGTAYPVIAPGDPLRITASSTQSPRRILALTIDGSVVLEGDPGTTELEYEVTEQPYGQGVHAVGLVTNGLRGESIATAQFVVSHGDEGE